MFKESDVTGVRITGIRVNLVDRSIELESDQQPIAKLSLTQTGLLFEAKPSALPQSEAVTPVAEPAGSEPSLDSDEDEKERTAVLSGRLKSKPREGRSDSRGNP